MSLIEIARLSDAQQGELAAYGKRWASRRGSTTLCDRAAAEAGVIKAYAAAGLAPPGEIVWAGGPVELASSWARSRGSAGDNVRSLVIDFPCRKSEAGVDRVVGLAVRVALAGEPRLSRVPAYCSSIEEAVLREGERVRPRLGARLASIFAPRKRASLSFASSSYALHSAPSLGPLEFFHDVCNLVRKTKALRGLWAIARNASWMIPHRQVCWLAERPHIVHHDLRGRLHCPDGPAVDPLGADQAALETSRERVLAVATVIVPGHGPAFRPGPDTPR